MIEKIDLYIGMAITGLCTGIGSTIGSYIANRGIVKHIDRLIKKR